VRVRQAAVSGHLLANALDLPALQGCHGTDGDVYVAILGGREPHVHELSRPAIQGRLDLSAESAVGNRRTDCGTVAP